MVRVPGTVPVRGAHRLDEAALAAYLEQHLKGFAAPASVCKFSGGHSNPTYLVETPAARYVLRKKPPGRLLPSAHAVDREFRVLEALAGTGVPVPRVLHFCELDEVIGTPFYVMEYVGGRILRDPLLPGMSPAGRRAVYAAMNETLARLHNVDWRAAGLHGFGKPDQYIARQVALWSKQYRASKTRDDPAMDRLMDWLPRHIPSDESTSVVHGDYRLENLVFDAREPRVVAVLDWELSTLGHPLCDLAFNAMTYYLPADNAMAPGFTGVDLADLGIPSERDYVADYCRRTGRDGIGDWSFYMAFSLFRTAAIQQGVYARALKGNASSRTAEGFGELYGLVAEQGVRLIG